MSPPITTPSGVTPVITRVNDSVSSSILSSTIIPSKQAFVVPAGIVSEVGMEPALKSVCGQRGSSDVSIHCVIKIGSVYVLKLKSEVILVHIPPGEIADPSLASIVTVTGCRVTRSRVTHIMKLPTPSSTVSSGRPKVTVTTVCVCVRDDAYVCGGGVGVMCVCVCVRDDAYVCGGGVG